MPISSSILKAAVLAGALTGSAAAHAALVEYTSRDAFNAATTLRSVETNVAPPGLFYILNNLNYNGIQYPDYAYMIDPAYAPTLYQWQSGPVLLLKPQSKLSFAPTNAFAADFGGLPDGFTITVTINGVSTDIPTPAQRQLTFFGWTSDMPFSSVLFSTRALYLILDNVTRGYAEVGPPPPVEVPEPASLAMMVLGLLGIAARRRSAAR